MENLLGTAISRVQRTLVSEVEMVVLAREDGGLCMAKFRKVGKNR